MQALARLLSDLKYRVSGSDQRDFAERKELEEKGVEVFIGHSREHLTSAIDEVIFSAAIPSHNVELRQARRLNLPLKSRAAALGELMKERKGIAVAGTHGKTTTSAILATILKKAGFSPTLAIGGEVRSIKSSAELGEGDLMVAEACEYKRSFLELNPTYALITNVEPDHLDYYRNFGNVRSAFGEFVSTLPRRGALFAWGDNYDVLGVAQKAKCPVIRFGFDASNDWHLENFHFSGGFSRFTIVGPREKFNVKLPLPGRHLALDALAAVSCARFLGAGIPAIKQALAFFQGSRRRFEILGKVKGVTVVDDYGHHPTEIRAVLEAARMYFPQAHLWVVFQPHQLSRTRLFLEEFARSFKRADGVLVAPIYAVRDKESESIKSSDLIDTINRFSHNARAMGGVDRALNFLRKKAKRGDVILTLGAGETDKFARRIIQEF